MEEDEGISAFRGKISHHMLLPLSPNHAIDFASMTALDAALDAHESEAVFVLRGHGPYFALGGDLKAFSSLMSAEDGLAMARRMDQILCRIEALPAPAFVLVNGAAFGGGVELLGAFDHIIAVTEATFGFTQGRFGLPPGWGGRTRLGRRVGMERLDRWLAEQTVIPAETALSTGLIDEILPEDAWDARMRELRRHPPPKRSVTDGQTASIAAEQAAFAEAWASDAHHRLVADFLNRAKR